MEEEPVVRWVGWGVLRRDLPYIVALLVLFGLLLVVVLYKAEDEAVCDARYRDFVVSCFESTGRLPSWGVAGVNVTYDAWGRGEQYLTDPEARDYGDVR